ncbi:MAG: hypothetical protein HOQ24_02395, partial [Mycobacteriaceae bacterium]|nr:hypothetical protein [Mycobacteriaceae bacterium]
MPDAIRSDTDPEVAFVLGGGGYLGGYQVGMLRALFERGITPDIIVGTSVGSIQGAMVAADPTLSVIEPLTQMWLETAPRGVMKVKLRALLENVARMRPALSTQDGLRELLVKYLGENTRFEDLAVPFQCVAASVERATARYFDTGPLVPAVLASSAIPGLWPPVQIGDEHFIDGGVVETVPMTRMLEYGVKSVYVLRLRQREQPLRTPRTPWALGRTVFEVSRRHRLGQVINMRPDGVAVHLLPTGEELLEPPDNGVYTSVREQTDTIVRRVAQGYASACDYLDGKEGRRSATVRAKGRAAGAGGNGAVSPFVASKVRAHFQLFDHDGDGLLQAEDYTVVADRVAAAFGHPPDSKAAADLRAGYAHCWASLCRVAGANVVNGIGYAAYARALTTLVQDPAGYERNIHPIVDAFLAAADTDGDQVLNRTETHTLLCAFGARPRDARAAVLRLDTNGDGVINVDELDEAFRDYFTSDDPGRIGNALFGARPAAAPASREPAPT